MNETNEMKETNEETAVATKPLTLWYAYIQWEHDILFLAKTKEIAESIARTEWEGYPVVIKQMEVTE